MSPLRVAPFRRLAVAWTFTNFGDSALYLTLAIWVKDLTGSSARAGLVFLFLALPVFFAPLAGRYADRHSRRTTVVAANLVTAAGVMALTSVRGASDVWLIYVVTFGYGLLGYVTSAARSGLVRDLLDDSQLARGNGVLSTIDQALKVLSPLVGAAAYAQLGGTSVAVFTAATLVAAALITSTVDVTEHVDAGAVDSEGTWVGLTAGFRHVRRTAPLGRTTAVMAVAIGVTGFGNATIFAVLEGLSRPPEFFSVLAAIQGVGGIVGGITAAWLVGRVGECGTVALGLAVLGVSLGVFAVPNLPVVVVAVAVGGVAIPWTIVAFFTMTQRLTPGALQGRVSAAANMALSGPQTVGTAVGAALIAVVDYRILVGTMGLVITACALPLVAISSAGSLLVDDTPGRLWRDSDASAPDLVRDRSEVRG